MITILVPVDLSPSAARVCAVACTLAARIGGKLILLHIVPPPPVLMNDAFPVDPGLLAETVAAREKLATRQLRSLVQRCTRRKVPVTMEQDVGEPVAAILARATATKADYIVIGSHGHGAFFDLILGSTAQGVLHKARCPVLVVPVPSR